MPDSFSPDRSSVTTVSTSTTEHFIHSSSALTALLLEPNTHIKISKCRAVVTNRKLIEMNRWVLSSRFRLLSYACLYVACCLPDFQFARAVVERICIDARW